MPLMPVSQASRAGGGCRAGLLALAVFARALAG